MKKWYFILILFLLVSCQDNSKMTNNKDNQAIKAENLNAIKTIEVVAETIEDVQISKSDEASQVNTTFESFEVMIIADVLNSRKSNDIESEVIGKLKYGDFFTIEGKKIDKENRDWYKINLDGNEAWIAGWFCLEVYRADSVDEFLSAIGSERVIVLSEHLSSEKFDLRDQNNLNDFVDYHAISNVNNMIIQGNREAPLKCVTDSGGAVIRFYSCSDIKIIGLDLGHNSDYCVGGVVELIECENVVIEDSILFGCGAVGLIAMDSNVEVYRSKIWDCSEAALDIQGASSILVEDSVIKEVPFLFVTSYAIDYNEISFKNSIIEARFMDGSPYSDQLYSDAIGVYIVDNNQYSMTFENTICIPKEIINDDKSLVIDWLKSLDMTSYFRVNAVPLDDAYGLTVEVDYTNLEDKSKEGLKLHLDEIIRKADQVDFISVDSIDGIIVDEYHRAATWVWDNETRTLVFDQVYYPYTLDYLGVTSVDFKAYLDSLVDIKNVLRMTNMEVDIYPSDLIDGQLIHKASFDMVNIADDSYEYLGSLLELTYNQSKDKMEVKINNKLYGNFYNLENETLLTLDEYNQMINLLKEKKESVEDDGLYRFRYDLTDKEMIFIKDTFKKIMTTNYVDQTFGNLKFEENYMLTYNDMPESIKCTDLVFQEDKDLLILTPNLNYDDFEVLTLVNDNGSFKLNSVSDVVRLERTWFEENRYDGWIFNYYGY